MADTFDELGEGLDPDGPSAEDLDRFGGEMVTCPHCGAQAPDSAAYCHKCGERLDERPPGARSMPMWAWITLFLVIMMVIGWAVM